MSNKNQNLIWIDLEMTGLNPQSDRILEIATIVTDKDLNIIAEGPVFAIKQSDDLLDAMDAWNTRQHNGSGLVTRVREAGVSEAEAEAATIAFLQQHIPEGASPMCGNSVCQDKQFLVKYMPALCRYFHYRQLDVSTLKELAQRWQPDLPKGFKKRDKHIALEDIRDSIDELRYYRENFIKSMESIEN